MVGIPKNLKYCFIGIGLFGIWFGEQCLAQNPIVPPGIYIADPEAHVWNDGKLYVYGSQDESDAYWCSYKHSVLSTTDLKHWNVTEQAFSSRGEADGVPEHDDLLFAPDCAYKDGTYYLYYCSPNKQFTEGVATSTSPLGPFTNGKPIAGARQIDPAVLIDEDSKAYYYWGQQSPKVAPLSADMKSIDSTQVRIALDEKGTQFFHEGSSIRRIRDKYYLVFADESRRRRPTCLGYAISDSPLGPFEYKGVIIDNYGSDPAVWNNHGSIEKFGGQWYVFYHRSTHNSRKFRKACVEPITINPDGTIDEVEMTTQGASGPLTALRRFSGAMACQLSGNVRIVKESDRIIPNEMLSEIQNGDWAAYKYIDFSDKPKNIRLKYTSQEQGTIYVRLDSAKGREIGKINVTSSSKLYTITSTKINVDTGTHAIYLVFETTDNQSLHLDWFEFY